MPPSNIDIPGQRITDPAEIVIRRHRRDKRQPIVYDQRTRCYRLPTTAFEPRLPENRPNATRHDKYLSVNIASSLRTSGLPSDWGCDHAHFLAGKVSVEAVQAANLTVTWEPIESGDPTNPHHGAINGVVELYYRDQDEYVTVLSSLARASTVLPECLPEN